MVASPTDIESLDVEREKARLEDATHELRDNGLAELIWLEAKVVLQTGQPSQMFPEMDRVKARIIRGMGLDHLREVLRGNHETA